MKRIAALDDYQRATPDLVDWTRLATEHELVVFDRHIGDEATLVEALRDFDAVIAMRERTALTRSILAALPRLELIVTTGMGNAAIDVDAAAERGTTVCGTGGIVTPTSELTWGLILAVARNIPVEDADVRAGGWQRTIGIDLAGKTLGLLGAGRIGGLVADVGRAFRMDLIAWSQNLTAERAADVGATLVTKDELFGRADVLSVHLVLSDRTRHLVGATELAKMKPGAILVNTSRGPIIDEAALVAALEGGTIGGAGLDVFDREPLPSDHPLRSTRNTVITPHVGYVTDTLYDLFYREILEDFIAFYDTREPVRVIL